MGTPESEWETESTQRAQRKAKERAQREREKRENEVGKERNE